jgi:hypothetical protein
MLENQLYQNSSKNYHSHKKKHVLPPLLSPPLHIPLMHHLTSACTAAAAHAMQVSVPVRGVCVHAQQRCNLDRFFSGQGSGLLDSRSWLGLAASALVQRYVTRTKLGGRGSAVCRIRPGEVELLFGFPNTYLAAF